MIEGGVDQVKGVTLKSHYEILEMLDGFERISPHVLSIFIENAQSKGVYKSLRES